MSLTDIVKKVDDIKPKVDRFIDPLVTFGVVNGAYVAGAHELVNNYLEPSSLTHSLALMVAGAGAIALNYFGVKKTVNALQNNNHSKIAQCKGSGVLGWLKTTGLALSLAALVGYGTAKFDSVETPVPKPPKPPVTQPEPQGKGFLGRLSDLFSQYSSQLVLENEQGKFVYTGNKSKGGFHIFEYSGKVQKDGDISNLFDKLDTKDQFRNTGTLNVKREDFSGVKIEPGQVYFVAKMEELKKKNQSSAEYTQIDYTNKKLQQKIKAGKFEKGFLKDIEKMCERLDMHAMGLLSVMDYETMGTFSPSIKNKGGSSGRGLIQFMDYTAKGLGTTTTKLAKMSQREQLKFVESYFELNRNGGDYSKPQDIALGVFYPRAMGKPDYVIGCIKKKCSKTQRKNYWANPLDKNKDKVLTAKEYTIPALSRGYLKKII